MWWERDAGVGVGCGERGMLRWERDAGVGIGCGGSGMQVLV